MKKQPLPRLNRDGLPTDARAWTPADWASLWRMYKRVVREVAARHAGGRR